MNNISFIYPETMTPSKDVCQPASYIRKEFQIKGPLCSAKLRTTALGVYQLFINGKPVDEQRQLPGFTDYNKRVQYQENDITDLLNDGENCLSVIVADGWYRGCLGLSSQRCYYGDRIMFGSVLEISYADGTTEIMKADQSWKATQEGPITASDLKLMEQYDATKEMLGWNLAGFDDSTWHSCVKAVYQGKTIPQEGEKILEHERFKATVITTPNGEQILDFGQNLSGHVEFTVTGHAGQIVSLVMGETMDENGNFTLKNLSLEGDNGIQGGVGQKLTYVLKDGKQTYKSTFLISGYRYVRLIDWPEKICGDNFTSIAIYSDLPENGSFECSNQDLNQLVHNSRWAMKSNFVDIPTDCPTRERAGWTGDINVYCETASYFTDTRRFLKKWLHDFIGLQTDEGSLPYIVPKFPMAPGGNKISDVPYSSAGWSDALAHVPTTLYSFYGEKEILEQVYEPLKKYVEFNRKRAARKHKTHFYKMGNHYKYILDTGFHFGEWLEPGSVMVKDGIKALFFPDAEVATAWFYNTVKELSEISGILGKTNECRTYRELASNIRDAYRKEFIKHGNVQSKRQCRYVRPVYMGLVTKSEADSIMKTLADKIKKNDYKLGTGFLTTWQVMQALSDHGQTETAYKLLLNEKCPGWIYEIRKGATTTWENWQGINDQGIPKDSHNHYAPGAVVGWLFSHCAGIRPVAPGFKKILIQPVPGGGLTWAKASYKSVSGLIVSEWEIKAGQFTLSISVPDGCQTTVKLPDGSVVKDAVSGIYSCRI